MLGGVGVLLLLPHASCGPACDDPYPVGTTFTVKVPHAYSGCHVSFDAGTSYALVAGPLTGVAGGDGAACDANSVSAPPSFTTTDYTISHCSTSESDLVIRCQLKLPDCSATSDSRIYYSTLPKSRGETVSSRLQFGYSPSSPECLMTICTADIPVTITW